MASKDESAVVVDDKPFLLSVKPGLSLGLLYIYGCVRLSIKDWICSLYEYNWRGQLVFLAVSKP